MNYLKNIMLVTLIWACIGLPNLYGQDANVLSVGDKLSREMVLNNVLNTKQSSIRLANEAGKWLLLDFWGTYCPACIVEMPKMARIREKFADQLEVLLIAGESSERVSQFLDRSPKVVALDLPIVTGDNLLSAYFPHRIIPHVVWVDPSGVVRAITGGEEVTEENVQQVLSSLDVGSLRQKNDNLTWDYTKPLGGQEEADDALFRSVFKKYDPTISSAQSTHRDTTHPKRYYNHIYISNQIPIGMYYSAYMIFTGNYGTNINPNRIEVAVQDSQLRMQYANAALTQPFFPNKFPYQSWANKGAFYQDNLFSYDLLLARGVPDSVFLDYVFSDLNKYFPVKGMVENRKRTCLVVKVEDKAAAEDAIRSSGEKPRMTISKTQYGVNNHSFREFIKGFSHFRSLPIIDETGIDIPVDLVIDFGKSPMLQPNMGLVVNMFPFDEEMFIAEMKKHHLTVQREVREIPVLVFYD